MEPWLGFTFFPTVELSFSYVYGLANIRNLERGFHSVFPYDSPIAV